jgi:hypothetical protein
VNRARDIAVRLVGAFAALLAVFLIVRFFGLPSFFAILAWWLAIFTGIGIAAWSQDNALQTTRKVTIMLRAVIALGAGLLAVHLAQGGTL